MNAGAVPRGVYGRGMSEYGWYLSHDIRWEKSTDTSSAGSGTTGIEADVSSVLSKRAFFKGRSLSLSAGEDSSMLLYPGKVTTGSVTSRKKRVNVCFAQIPI
jgi:hypothetical protein